jgi:hypothetical protein
MIIHSRRKSLNTLLCLVFSLVPPSLAQAAEPTPEAARAAYEKLKTLKGNWVDTTGEAHGKPATEVTYRVVGSGSAVVETLFPGADHEMVTVYHMDGNALVLTHYCAARNQPRMKAVAITPQRIDFDFAGGTNINPAKDAHMHSGHLAWNDPETLAAEWVGWANGKPSDHTVKFLLKREKPQSGQ